MVIDKVSKRNPERVLPVCSRNPSGIYLRDVLSPDASNELNSEKISKYNAAFEVTSARQCSSSSGYYRLTVDKMSPNRGINAFYTNSAEGEKLAKCISQNNGRCSIQADYYITSEQGTYDACVPKNPKTIYIFNHKKPKSAK